MLIVISNPTDIKEEKLILDELFEAGLGIFHLRKPNWNKGNIERLLEEINPVYHPRIALHQHHDLALNYDINRYHYPEQSRKLLEANNNQAHERMMLENKVLSTSIHSLSDLNKVRDFDYVFYGPVFKSISKPGYQGVLARDFKLDKTNLQPKVIALGGIDASNIGLTKEMNFDGVALLGCIWKEPSKAVEAFKNMEKLC